MSSHFAVRHYIRELLLEATPTVVVPSSYPEADDAVAKVANDELRQKLESQENSREKTLYNKIGSISAEVSEKLSSTSARDAITSEEDVVSLCTGIADMLDKDAADPSDLGWPYRTSLFLTSWIHSSVNPTSEAIKNAYALSNPLPYLLAVLSREAYESIDESLLREGSAGQKAVDIGMTMFRHVFGGGFTTIAAEAAVKASLKRLKPSAFLDKSANKALARQGASLLGSRYPQSVGHPDIQISDEAMDSLITAIVKRATRENETVESIVKDSDLLQTISEAEFPGGVPPGIGWLCKSLGERIDDVPVPRELPRGSAPSDVAARASQIDQVNNMNARLKVLREERDKASQKVIEVSNKAIAKLTGKAVAGSVILVLGAALVGGVSAFFTAEYGNKTLTPHQVAAVIIADSIRSNGRDSANIQQGSVMYEILKDVGYFSEFEDAFGALSDLFSADEPTPAEMKATAAEFRASIASITK